jgi:hypothetical protein
MPTVTIELTPGQVEELLRLAGDLRDYFAKKRGIIHKRGRQKNPHQFKLGLDPWVDILAGVGGDRIASRDLMALHIGITPDRMSTADTHRLAAVMRHLGWGGPKMLRLEGRAVRGYERLRYTDLTSPMEPPR